MIAPLSIKSSHADCALFFKEPGDGVGRAAGALIVLLLWVYYSAQIFLLGAEFTKVYVNRHGSMQDARVSDDTPLQST